MLFELIIFAVILVGLQIVGGLIVTKVMFNHFTSEKFIRDYAKKAVGLTKIMTEEMEKSYEEE